MVILPNTISNNKMSNDETTTELVDARPTPTVPLSVLYPLYEPTIPTINPKKKVLIMPGIRSENSTE